MNLIRVDSPEENKWLDVEFAKRDLYSIGIGPLVFLGGRDAQLNGEWRWRDGVMFWNGAPVDGLYNNWYSKPLGRLAVCMGMAPGGLWHNRSCVSGDVVYACEGP